MVGKSATWYRAAGRLDDPPTFDGAVVPEIERSFREILRAASPPQVYGLSIPFPVHDYFANQCYCAHLLSTLILSFGGTWLAENGDFLVHRVPSCL